MTLEGQYLRAEAMAQQLRALAALLEDLSSIPSTHMVTHSHLNSCSKALDAFSRLPQAPHIHNAQTLVQTKHPYTGHGVTHL